ncbi:MAG: MFS transporter, partial [Halanaerobium sp. MSAO_Bac5]
GTIGAAVLSNWVVGFINDFLGIRTGFIFLILLLIILFIITIYLKNLTLSDQLNPQEN